MPSQDTSKSFNVDALLENASHATGLTDFGEENFTVPLNLLVEDYNAASHLNPLGRFAARFYLHRLLCCRLELTHNLQITELQAEPVDSPVFILGLPRTGSTLLHELLACHPLLRAPTLWESTYLPRKTGWDSIRVWLTSSQLFFINAIAPGFRQVHPLGATRPHECVTIQAQTMRSMQFHAAHRVPGYHQWLETDCDWQPAYHWHRQYLNWLAHGEPKRRWILKAPGHLLGLAALNEIYPDARFIQLHRHPEEVLPSMASLFLHLREPFAREVSHKEIGQDVTHQWQRGLDETLQLRASDPELDGRFMDVYYLDLVSDPMTQVEKILGFAQLPETPGASLAMQTYLQKHPQHKHGKHQYSLDMFGLESNAVSEAFSTYIAAYNL